jgi:hypothetical protein
VTPRFNPIDKIIQMTVPDIKLKSTCYPLQHDELPGSNNLCQTEDGAGGNDLPNSEQYAYLQVADSELKREIIQEWQRAMSTSKLMRLVCAVCSRKKFDSEIIHVRSSRLPLYLLQNSDLPEICFPKTYDFEAYDYALLRPDGMVDKSRKGMIKLCKECHHALMKRKVMPKYVLANWLYYGRECLPSDVSAAFRTASQMELMLIAQARASNICFKFSDAKH